jgi:hypothetical protein
MSSLEIHKGARSYEDGPVEEQTGLLSGATKPQICSQETSAAHARTIYICLTTFLATIVIAFFLRPFTYCSRSQPSPAFVDSGKDNLDFSKTGGVRSNGTQSFRKTVIMVSIDGLRYDLTEYGETISYRFLTLLEGPIT